MTLRWFGENYDSVKLWQIRQIPGVVGVISTLYDTAPGEEWSLEAIRALKKQINDAGLGLLGIESVNIHDAIKVGSPDRDMYIENYIRTIKKLASENIRMVCYNFMPVFDWTRSDLAKPREDGSTVLAYDQSKIDALDPEKTVQSGGRQQPRLRHARVGAGTACPCARAVRHVQRRGQRAPV